MNPFDMTGPEFLAFYFVILAVGLILAIWLRWQLKKPAPQQPLKVPELSPYEVACLSGGKPVVLQAALAALVQRGVVQVSSDGKKVEATAPLPNDVTSVEAELYDHLSKNPDCSLRTIFRADSDEVTRF